MKQRRSWSCKSRLEMVLINLNQQLLALRRHYPNYAGSIEMLRQTIESFKVAERPIVAG